MLHGGKESTGLHYGKANCSGMAVPTLLRKKNKERKKKLVDHLYTLSAVH